MQSRYRQIILVDIDGTIADCSNRLQHIQNGNSDWDKFFDAAEMFRDKLIKITASVVCKLSEDFDVVYLTGRPERTRQITLAWLQTHELPPGKLIMRPDGNREQDDEIKVKNILDNFHKNDIALALEDRDRVVKAYRKLGIVCYQVAEGSY